MLVINKSLKIHSDSKFQIIDLTNSLNNLVSTLKIANGTINIFSKHSTGSIVINEKESGLLKDFENILNEYIPGKNGYNHDSIDDNAASHLKAFLLGSSETIPIVDGKLDLGTWQSVFFIEFDGPRQNRILSLTIIGE